MHIITRKRLTAFSEKHPECASAIEGWYRITKHSNFNLFVELRQTFPSADQVGKYTIFNIGGNKARLVAAIHYNAQRIYIRHVMTHAEYSRDSWRKP